MGRRRELMRGLDAACLVGLRQRDLEDLMFECVKRCWLRPTPDHVLPRVPLARSPQRVDISVDASLASGSPALTARRYTCRCGARCRWGLLASLAADQSTGTR